MKIAIVHDWLVTDAGAEKVLKAICELYPEADIFSLVDFLNDKDRQTILNGKYAQTSFIQKLPFAKKHFRNYLPLFPRAIESLDLSIYQLIISSSWAVAKGIKKKEAQLHINYCHTPIRYAWDLYDEYTSNLKQPKKIVVQKTLHVIKNWDYKVSSRVDYFIANSSFVQERILKNYKREATIIHPPADTKLFTRNNNKEDYYLTVSRLVPYKKVSMIVKAFNQNGKKLIVIGSGEEYDYIKKIAKENIIILGWQKRNIIIENMQKAKAFIYAAEEDFGIVPVEAMACGTPVIAYGVGGIRDSVVENVTGLFFDQQSPQSLNDAIKKFESMNFSSLKISQHAQKFSTNTFKEKFQNFIDDIIHKKFLKQSNNA